MRVVVNQFMSLDGVVQAPGGAEEDTDGGFAHGGWSMPYFDPEIMGSAVSEGMSSAEALLFGLAHLAGNGSGVAGNGPATPTRRPDECDQEVRRVTDADAGRPELEQHDLAVARDTPSPTSLSCAARTVATC